MNYYFQVNELVEPLRDFFSCLFFASIGKNRTFLVHQGDVIIFESFYSDVENLRLNKRKAQNDSLPG